MGARPCDWQEASSGMWGSLPGWMSRLLGGRRDLLYRAAAPSCQPAWLPPFLVCLGNSAACRFMDISLQFLICSLLSFEVLVV